MRRKRRTEPEKPLRQVCREAEAAGLTYGNYVAATEYPVEVEVPASAAPVPVRMVSLPEDGPPGLECRETRRSGKIRAMREAGMSVEQIARALGVSIYSVYRNMRLAGIPTDREAARAARGGDPRHGAEIRDMLAGGRRPAEIAQALGLHITTVHVAMRRMGIGAGYLRADEAKRRRRAEQARALLSRGMSVQEIAAELGVSTGTVYGDLRRRTRGAGHGDAE